MINIDDFLPEPGVIVHPKEGDGTESSLPQQETNTDQGKVDNSADGTKDLPSAQKTSSLMQDINFMIHRMKEEGPNAGVDPTLFMGKIQTVLQYLEPSNKIQNQSTQDIIQNLKAYIHQVSEAQQGKMSAEAIAGLGVLKERLEALQTQPEEVMHTQEAIDFANAVPLEGGNPMPLGQTHSQGQPLQSVQPTPEAGQAPEQNGAFAQSQSDFNTTKNSPQIQTISEEGEPPSLETETGNPDGSDVFPTPQGFVEPSPEEEDLINEEKEALGISEPAQHVQPTQEAGQVINQSPAEQTQAQQVVHTQEALDFANAVPLEQPTPSSKTQQETTQQNESSKENNTQPSDQSTSTEQDQTEQKEQQSQELDEAPEDSVYDPNDPEGKKKKKSKEGLAASILALFAQLIPPNMAIFGIKRKGMGK